MHHTGYFIRTLLIPVSFGLGWLATWLYRWKPEDWVAPQGEGQKAGAEDPEPSSPDAGQGPQVEQDRPEAEKRAQGQGQGRSRHG